MRYLLLCIFCAASFTSIAQDQATLQAKYLPKEVKNLYIGISKDDLQKLRPEVKETNVLGYPEENFKKGDIKTITYQINSDNNSVYEFILEYRNTAKAIATAKQLFKKPNDVSKKFPLAWKIKIDDTLTLKCWIFNNKICVADEKQF
jgi:hypothetical protein